jgi:hypothetical protein
MTERNQFTKEQEEWLAALESGEWAQGKRDLWSIVEGRKCYCCLGVATEMFDPSYRGLKPGQEGLHSANAFASETVRDLLELYDNGGRALCDNERALTILNDIGVSFQGIAAIIREKPWVYFRNFDQPTT